MHIEKYKTNGKYYLRLVENKRIIKDGQSVNRKKLILSLGRIDQYDDGQPNYLERLRQSFRDGRPLIPALQGYVEYAPKSVVQISFEQGSTFCVAAPRRFAPCILDSVFAALGLDQLFASIKHTSRIKYDLQGIVRLLTYGRILEPASKLATMEQNEDYYRPLVKSSNNFNVYDALDVIYANRRQIIQRMNAEKDGGIVNIKSKMDYELICSYMELCSSEERQTKVLEKEVQQHPLWDMFFKDVKGCGPLMSAVCIAYFDVDKARHVSSFWKYAGLDTFTYMTSDGKLVTEGRSKKHAKFTKCTYIDRETGEEKEKYGLGYNPVLKTKLCGVLADCMIKLGLEVEKDPRTKEPILDANGEKIRTAKSKYVQAYLDYLCRINQRPDTKDYTAAHKHNMAKRYMIKQFVRDLWVVWRGAAGYEVSEPYEVAKLGNKPHKYNEAQCKAAAETKKCG